MWKHMRRAAPAAGLMLMAAAPADAAIFAYTIWGDAPGTPNDAFAAQPNAVSIFNDPVHVEHSKTATQQAIDYSVAASADNVGGALSFHAAAGLEATSATLGAGSSAIAGASGGFTDQVVIGGVDGETGFIRLAVDYDGSVFGESTGAYQALAYMQACATAVTCITDPAAQTALLANVAGSNAASQSVSGRATIGVIAFQYNVPFYVTAYLTTIATFTGSAGSMVEASASFQNTASLRPIEVRRADGTLDAGATIVSAATGESYAVAVPEPQTWGLMILGFGLSGAAVRARRARLA